MNKLRIVFMGTPEFAVASLEALVKAHYTIVGVITAPDKPKGRGRQVSMSAVKTCALVHHLPVLQPSNLKDLQFLQQLKALKADLQIVVAFRMLPEAVWNMPPLGTFNLHASLLPQYRGAAPINWAIINGEKETGVTTFFLQHQIDTGAIILQEKEPILPTDNVGTLYTRLMELGAQAVVNTVARIEQHNVNPTPQPKVTELKPAPKLYKETCRINWQQPAEQAHNFVRGLSPYPAAWCTLNEKDYKIFETEFTTSGSLAPGSWATDGKTYLNIGCQPGTLGVRALQLQGKKRMHIEDFLRGNKI